MLPDIKIIVFYLDHGVGAGGVRDFGSGHYFANVESSSPEPIVAKCQ